MRSNLASTGRPSATCRSSQIATIVALGKAGFRRYSTYRQATAAAVFTNSTFGFLRCYVLLAVVASAPRLGIAGGIEITSTADLPAGTAALLGIDADRRPSEAMIRRLLQAVDPDLLATAIGAWLTARMPAPASGSRRAIAVDGKALRGSRTRNGTARHVLAGVAPPDEFVARATRAS